MANSGGGEWATTTTWVDSTTSSTGYIVFPTTITPAKPEPESNLDWLRRQVAEVCEEAWAA